MTLFKMSVKFFTSFKAYDILPAITALFVLCTSTTPNDNGINNNSTPPPGPPSIDRKDWVAMQAHYCGMTCQNGRKLKADFCSSLSCSGCDCDEHCDILGTCCPSYNQTTDTYHYSFQPSIEDNPHQWYDKIDCRHPEAHTSSFLTVVRCPDSWPDQDVRDKCENPTRDSMESITPLSDMRTRLVFLNVYCAMCHGFDHEEGDELETIHKTKTLAKNEKNDGNENIDENDGLIVWKLWLRCEQFQTMYTITDKFAFYKALQDNGCEFEIKPPDIPWLRHRPCFQSVITTPQANPSDTCDEPDVLLNQFCHSAPPAPALTVGRESNMFCLHACQPSKLPPLQKCQEKEVKPIVITVETDSEQLPPIYLLFSPFPRRVAATVVTSVISSLENVANEVVELVECPAGYWPNDEGNCTKAACTPGKVLDTNTNSSTCETAISDIRGLVYSMHLILVALTDVTQEDITEGLDSYIREKVGEATGYSLFDFELTYTAVFCPENDDNTALYYRKTVEIHVSAYIIGPYSKSRDEFENKTLGALFQSPWDAVNVTLKSGVQKTIILQLVSVGQNMAHLYRILQEQRRIVFPPRPVQNGNRMSFHNRSLFSTMETSTSCTEKKFDAPETHMRIFHTRHMNEFFSRMLAFKDKFIDLVPTLRCPFVEVNMTDCTKLKNGSLQFTTFYGEEPVKITYVTPAISYQGGKLYVCLDIFKSITESRHRHLLSIIQNKGSISPRDVYPPVRTENKTSVSSKNSNNALVIVRVAYYTDMVCNCLSILCLSMTFLTYCLFPSLRSLPGRNNMCLCISLLGAQASLLVTSVFGTRGLMHGGHCVFHAILLHYSWLASFCWMNTCCVHMYRVFTSNRSPSAWSETKTHRYYCLFSFGTPVIIVILTIVTTHVITQGNSIGYDERVCSLDVSTSPFISILAFLTPFAITMIANTALFFRTVKEIVDVTRLQQNAMATTSRQGVITYFKLSTVTGLFWSLTVAAVLTSNAILVLIATPLAGLQGLFIFASFTFTKKIGRMYIELLTSANSSSDSSTLNNGRGNESNRQTTKPTTV